MMVATTEPLLPAGGPVRLSFDGGFGVATDDEIQRVAEANIGLFSGQLSKVGGSELFTTFATTAERDKLERALISLGANPATVRRDRAEADLARPPTRTRIKLDRNVALAWSILGTASMALSAYHGYRRNRSIGWALVWGFFGALAPVITPTIAVAQGFGKRKGS